MRLQHEKEETEERKYREYMKSQPDDTDPEYPLPENEELPFSQ